MAKLIHLGRPRAAASRSLAPSRLRAWLALRLQAKRRSRAAGDRLPPPVGFGIFCDGQVVYLSWALDGEPTWDGFRIYRNGVLLQTIGPSTADAEDDDVSPGQEYRYWVVAFDALHEGAPTPTLSVVV